MNCRHCHATLRHTFLNLGFAPPSNAYLTDADLKAPELYWPLRIHVCDRCWLVQTEDYARADELFKRDYAYFSSTSSSWLAHSARYCEAMRRRLGLDERSFVVEVASNDGYLLKNFVAAGIPCLGIEPTADTAAAAEARGIPVERAFFTEALAQRLAAVKKQADLLVANNVYAHVPDINDFTAGLKAVLKPRGTLTIEFPHLLRLIEHNQFDTVYHEHYSYLSLDTVKRIFARHRLRVWDVQELPTHGGSLRIFGCHDDDRQPSLPAVERVLQKERRMGLRDVATYEGFQPRADRVKNDLLAFLVAQKAEGKTVAAYGAAAKGNTLLNYAGIKTDLIPFVCDAAPSKQGKYLPGSHIPIHSPPKLFQFQPDWVLILPWNIAGEVTDQLAGVREWGARFVTAVPHLQVH